MDKTFITQLMKVNGLSSDARDEEVREILEKAGWSSGECDEGIALLHSDGGEEEKKAKPKEKKAFYPGARTSSEHASSMLGVRVVLDPLSIHDAGGKRAGGIKRVLGYAFIAILSLLVALVIGVGFMFIFGIGPFYVPVSYL